MKRLAVLALTLQLAHLGGCGFAVKNPAKTAAIFGASIGLATCEMGGTSEHGKCALISGGAGVVLGLTVLAAMWLGTYEGDPEEDDTNSRVARPFQPRAPLLPEAPLLPKTALVPEYLKRTPEVYARQNGQIVPAPAADQAVAATFPASPVRGPLTGGRRITILTAKTAYQVGEEVRVIHVLDAPEPGHEVHVMGPKAIHGEFVDGVERTPPDPGPGTYDGRVLPSPAVDYNYEVTSYRFDVPGIHLIQWKVGALVSNVLAVDVKAAAPAP
jgi:hypothetical protein